MPVLYVDDEEENLELFRMTFAGRYAVRTARGADEALRTMANEPVGVVLTDERMPGMSGIELLEVIYQRHPDAGRIIVSAYSDAARLLAAINRGHAHEYVIKPWDEADLDGCIGRALTRAERSRFLAVQAELADLSKARSVSGGTALVGATGGLRGIYERAMKAAASDATVLLSGETGTGKEMVARLIHDHGSRAAGPFVAVNCAAVPDGLLESELFGHERGAFTGAHAMRRGRFELAHKGTLFLDEIGDVSAKVQVALLRVLQERTIERVGSSTAMRTDVRVIAATHRNLERMVKDGAFREDLFYRLNVLPIRLPALRERTEDLEPLLVHMLQKWTPSWRPPLRLAPDVVPALRAYGWPGNVRELENLVQRAVILASGEELTIDDFAFQCSIPESPPQGESEAKRAVRAEVWAAEAAQMRQLLLFHGGNCTKAAAALGIPRTTLFSRARKYGLL